MRVDIFTVSEETFSGAVNKGNIKRAQEKRLLELHIWDIRDFSPDPHRRVDDYPYGGGAGMILKPEPIFYGVRGVLTEDSKVVLLSPQGRIFNQKIAKELSKLPHIIFICGHYKGIDERVREYLAQDEISIGEYVLSGGEIPVLVILDATVRLIPGVVGDIESLKSDSFYSDTIDAPCYTRPADFEGMKVPEVLLSGNHAEIEKWRKKRRRFYGGKGRFQCGRQDKGLHEDKRGC